MIVRTINITRALAALLALVMLLSCSVFAAGITVSENEPADDAQYVISITENATCGVCRDTAPAEVVEAVRNGAEVTWTLNRLESYANPTGEFFPILDEEEMVPDARKLKSRYFDTEAELWHEPGTPADYVQMCADSFENMGYDKQNNW